MSETISATSDLNDIRLLTMACKRMGIDAPQHGVHKLFQRNKNGEREAHEGHAVSLPGWTYPVIVASDGQLHYDNYNGSWGKPETLVEFKKAYRVVQACDVLRRAGHRPLVKKVNGKLTVTTAVNPKLR